MVHQSMRICVGPCEPNDCRRAIFAETPLPRYGETVGPKVRQLAVQVNACWEAYNLGSAGDTHSNTGPVHDTLKKLTKLIVF
jgi:hypothetical protein